MVTTYLFWAPVTFPHVLASLEHLENLLNGGLFFLEFLHFKTLTASPRLLDQVLVCLFDKFNVFDPELFADDVQISDWVYIALNVDDLRIVETSHNLEDGINCSDVGQKSIAESCSGRCSSCQASDIVDGKVCWDHRFGLVL